MLYNLITYNFIWQSYFEEAREKAIKKENIQFCDLKLLKHIKLRIFL